MIFFKLWTWIISRFDLSNYSTENRFTYFQFRESCSYRYRESKSKEIVIPFLFFFVGAKERREIHEAFKLIFPILKTFRRVSWTVLYFLIYCWKFATVMYFIFDKCPTLIVLFFELLCNCMLTVCRFDLFLFTINREKIIS